MGSRSAILGAILLAAGCAAAEPPRTPAAAPVAPSPELEEWDRELPPHVRLADFDGEATHEPVRVVGDPTGAPIAGARIDCWDEPDLPHIESWEDCLDQSAVTDRDGFAVLRTKDRGYWCYIEAPGWAPWGDARYDEDFRLKPGVDFLLELRDWLDRPVPGARVELLLGCGHTPTVRSGVTGPDGRLLLRCVDPTKGSLWIQAPGVEGDNDTYWRGFDFLPKEGGVHVLRGRPSPVVEGRVLHADGTPAGDAIVGTRDGVHRGPWVRADGQGRFRILGVRPRARMVAYETPPRSWPDGVYGPQEWFESAPGVFHTVRLPPPEEDEESKPESPRLVVRVSTETPVSVTLPVLLVRETDGCAVEDDLHFANGEGAVSFEAEPGAYSVTAGAPAGQLRPASMRVVVGPDGAEASFALGANPVWKPRLVVRGGDGRDEDVTQRSGKFKVVTALGIAEATPSVEDGDAFHVPAEGAFVVEYQEPDGRRARAILEGPPSGEGPLLVLPPPAPGDEESDDGEVRAGPTTPRGSGTEIEVRAVDAAGAEIREFAVVVPDEVRGAEEGVVRLTGAAAGPLRFWVDAPGRRARDIRLVVREGEKRKVLVRLTRR